MQYLTIIKAILSLLPLLIQTIKALEDVLPAAGQGAAKLEMIREIIAAVSDKASEIWPSIEKAVAIIVAFFNKTGVFVK